MDKKIKYLILVLISIILGIHLLFFPQEVSLWIIRGVGLWWCFKGILYVLKLIEVVLNDEGY